MPATTTTTIISVCPKCGTIGKLRKHSCCGRGGSWFKNCGSPGNGKHDHTWYEGIQVCKVSMEQSKRALDQTQLNRVQQQRNHSSNDAGVVKSKTVITAAKSFEFTWAKTLNRIPHATSMITAAYTRADVSMHSPTRQSIDASMAMTASAQSADFTPKRYVKCTTNSKAISAEVTVTTFTPTNTPLQTPSATVVNILLSTSVNTSMTTFTPC